MILGILILSCFVILFLGLSIFEFFRQKKIKAWDTARIKEKRNSIFVLYLVFFIIFLVSLITWLSL